MLEPNYPTNLPDIVVVNDNPQPVGFYHFSTTIQLYLQISFFVDSVYQLHCIEKQIQKHAAPKNLVGLKSHPTDEFTIFEDQTESALITEPLSGNQLFPCHYSLEVQRSMKENKIRCLAGILFFLTDQFVLIYPQFNEQQSPNLLSR